MFTQVVGRRSPSFSIGRRLAVTSLLTLAMLAWAPDALANATPNQPSQYVVPDCESGSPATVYIDAGTVTNTTTLDLSADGGTAIGDSSGGDDNAAVTGENDNKDGQRGKHNNDKHKDKRDRDG